MSDTGRPARVRDRSHLYTATWGDGGGYGNHLAHHLGVILCLMKLTNGFSIYINGKPEGHIVGLDDAKKRAVELALAVTGNPCPDHLKTGIPLPGANRLREIARSA